MPARRQPPPKDVSRARPEAAWTFHIGSGALCLDFANTVSWRGSETPADHLSSYGELIRFAQQSKVVSEAKARRLRFEAAGRPAMATRALRRAGGLREALYRVFSGLAAGRVPLGTDLEALNATLPAALAHLRVAPNGQRFTWAWEENPAELDRLLWLVARDAAVFLISGEHSRLRTCKNPR